MQPSFGRKSCSLNPGKSAVLQLTVPARSFARLSPSMPKATVPPKASRSTNKNNSLAPATTNIVTPAGPLKFLVQTPWKPTRAQAFRRPPRGLHLGLVSLATSKHQGGQRKEDAGACPVLDVGPENSSSYTSSELSESEEIPLPLPPSAHKPKGVDKNETLVALFLLGSGRRRCHPLKTATTMPRPRRRQVICLTPGCLTLCSHRVNKAPPAVAKAKCETELPLLHGQNVVSRGLHHSSDQGPRLLSARWIAAAAFCPQTFSVC